MQHYSQDTVADHHQSKPTANSAPDPTLLQDLPASEHAGAGKTMRSFKGPKKHPQHLTLSYTEDESGLQGTILHGRTPSSGTGADPQEGGGSQDVKNFTEETLGAEKSVPRLLMKKEKIVQLQVPIEISGVKVHFPFKPYGCQIDYMNRVMEALNEGKNALLESPTGTGKTLSLLCATLAWVRHKREFEAQQQKPGPEAHHHHPQRLGDHDEKSQSALGSSGHGQGGFVADFNLPTGAVGGQAQAGNQGKKGPERVQIIYCSRTISQLSQVINELKSTAYDPKSVILASRDHTCVNPSLQEFKGYNLQNRCNRAIKSRKCEYFLDYSSRASAVPSEPYDIEDLHQIARELKICPFYMNKERAGSADLILMSYNYMLYESMRPNNTLNYQNSIIVFDEAHNVPKCAEDAASFQLDTDALLQLVFTLKNLQDAIQHSKQKFSSTINDIEGIRSITSGFLNYLQDYDFNSNEHDQERIQNNFLDKHKLAIPGHCIFNIFFQGINSERRCPDFEEHIFQSHWDSFWVKAFKRALADFSENYYDCSTLHNWFQFIQKVISFKGRFEDIHDYYVLLQETDAKKDSKLHLLSQQKQQGYNGVYTGVYSGATLSSSTVNKDNTGSLKESEKDSAASAAGAVFGKNHMPSGFGISTGPMTFDQQRSTMIGASASAKPVKNRILKFLCFNAGVCFNQIQKLKPRSIILTSGTLAPLQSFQAELQIDFKQNLENPHVISSDQVLISILKRGTDGQCFDLSYKNRESHGMIIDLGKTIARVASITPGGMLVFFPSYGLMEQCFDIWEKNGVSQLIASQKKMFKEPKDPKEYQLVIQKYYEAIFNDEARGSVLMGVCRGRISEGLDFSDNAARCVLLVGIPYPQMADPIVILKKEYLQKKNQANKIGLTGSQWYSQQATRAVNQAIGRVIRHVQDYGAIILMDHRYAYQSGKSQISKWLRDLISVNQNYNSLDGQMRQFFASMQHRSFVPKLKQLEQLQLELDNDEENLKIKNGLLKSSTGELGRFSHLKRQLEASQCCSNSKGDKKEVSNLKGTTTTPTMMTMGNTRVVVNNRRKVVPAGYRKRLDSMARGGDSSDQLSSAVEDGDGANLVNVPSSISNNTLVEESSSIYATGRANGVQIIGCPGGKGTNVTTAVCSGEASFKPEVTNRPYRQQSLSSSSLEHRTVEPRGADNSGDSSLGGRPRAPPNQKQFAELKEGDCGCSEIQIKSILAADGALSVCLKCQKKLEERFGGGTFQAISIPRKRTHKQHLQQSQKSGQSELPEQSKVAAVISDSSSSEMISAMDQYMPSSGTEKYYKFGEQEGIPNAEMGCNVVQLVPPHMATPQSSVNILEPRALRASKRQKKINVFTQKQEQSKQLQVVVVSQPSEEHSSSFFDTQHLTGKSGDDDEDNMVESKSDQSSDVGSEDEASLVKEASLLPRPKRKIPVIIPQARSPSQLKRKIKYMHQVGLNENPLGFKPPEDDNSQQTVAGADFENSRFSGTGEPQKLQTTPLKAVQAAAIVTEMATLDAQLGQDRLVLADCDSSQPQILQLSSQQTATLQMVKRENGEMDSSSSQMARASLSPSKKGVLLRPGATTTQRPLDRSQTSIFQFFRQRQQYQ